MNQSAEITWAGRLQTTVLLAVTAALTSGLVFPLSSAAGAAVGQNLLKNPGFEETSPAANVPPHWTLRADGEGKPSLTAQAAHQGERGIAIPAHAAVEQQVDAAMAGAYLARCWVKSESEQRVTFLLQEPHRPWAAYACAEMKVPANQWTQLEVFCPLDRDGTLTLTLGGMSKDFRFYHGAGSEMAAPIVADDFELIRCDPKASASSSPIAVWDTGKPLGPGFDWAAKDQWTLVKSPTHGFVGTPVFQARHLVARVRPDNGDLVVCTVRDGELKPRCILAPSPALPAGKCALVRTNDQTGIQVSSEKGDRSYIAWFDAQGLVRVQADHVPQFLLRDCRLRYGLLPSFAGTDLCYAPAKLSGKTCYLPSTQWFVGLADGGDSMLVTVWESDSQSVALGLSGEGENRLIDSLTIAADQHGFAFSVIDHARLWHQEPLQEDWLAEYTPIGWERPFPARWMSHFFVTAGGRPSFRQPNMDYSFPVADAKTRMWGVWFEDWNHYPFFFDGQRTIFHFEKTFIPNGQALLYFLEPAAADLFSPCEIVEQSLGREQAARLFDFDANRLRRLKYSTPDEFLYDRPVCATTTRLSKIKETEKTTVGAALTVHLYEFIREIRGRLDQYGVFFNQMRTYLAAETKAHPELGDYVAELDTMITEAQSRSKEIYATPLSEVQKKTDAMRRRLQEGKGDGFDCGNLDVRDIAGSQDDLCRHYNRLVVRLMQTAALKGSDSPQKAVLAKHVWDEARAILREPTRWESRRTLYFFEP